MAEVLVAELIRYSRDLFRAAEGSATLPTPSRTLLDGVAAFEHARQPDASVTQVYNCPLVQTVVQAMVARQFPEHRIVEMVLAMHGEDNSTQLFRTAIRNRVRNSRRNAAGTNRTSHVLDWENTMSYMHDNPQRVLFVEGPAPWCRTTDCAGLQGVPALTCPTCGGFRDSGEPSPDPPPIDNPKTGHWTKAGRVRWHVPFRCVVPALMDALVRYGNGRPIFLDTTFKTTRNQMSLSALSVLDDFYGTVTVAWCITDRIDAASIEPCLRAVFAECVARDPAWFPSAFMVDCDKALYNAIQGASQAVLGREVYVALCNIHVNRAISRRLQETFPRRAAGVNKDGRYPPEYYECLRGFQTAFRMIAPDVVLDPDALATLRQVTVRQALHDALVAAKQKLGTYCSNQQLLDSLQGYIGRQWVPRLENICLALAPPGTCLMGHDTNNVSEGTFGKYKRKHNHGTEEKSRSVRRLFETLGMDAERAQADLAMRVRGQVLNARAVEWVAGAKTDGCRVVLRQGADDGLFFSVEETPSGVKGDDVRRTLEGIKHTLEAEDVTALARFELEGSADFGRKRRDLAAAEKGLQKANEVIAALEAELAREEGRLQHRVLAVGGRRKSRKDLSALGLGATARTRDRQRVQTTDVLTRRIRKKIDTQIPLAQEHLARAETLREDIRRELEGCEARLRQSVQETLDLVTHAIDSLGKPRIFAVRRDMTLACSCWFSVQHPGIPCKHAVCALGMEPLKEYAATVGTVKQAAAFARLVNKPT